MGEHDGMIRLDLMDVTLDETQLDKSSVVEEGVTVVWDLSNFGNLLQMIGE